MPAMQPIREEDMTDSDADRPNIAKAKAKSRAAVKEPAKGSKAATKAKAKADGAAKSNAKSKAKAKAKAKATSEGKSEKQEQPEEASLPGTFKFFHSACDSSQAKDVDCHYAWILNRILFCIAVFFLRG